MIEVEFYDDIEDELLKYAVIISKHKNRWVFCKHKERDTYECPGGHREAGEHITDTAKRELYEETGAAEYSIQRLCVYSVVRKESKAEDKQDSYGMLYYAEIYEFDKLPDMEIERIEIFDELPVHWTYPEIQPKLIEYYMKNYM